MMSSVSVAVAIGMSVWRARELKNAETYGSARWATRGEIAAAGLLGGKVLQALSARQRFKAALGRLRHLEAQQSRAHLLAQTAVLNEQRHDKFQHLR